METNAYSYVYIPRKKKDAMFQSFVKGRLSLLFGANAVGFKLKPFLIYHLENPHVFKHINKHTLPVYYCSNPKTWMTRALFEDLFMNCFIPQALEYCVERGIPFKILLIMDSAPDHLPYLNDLHPDVTVVFMPPNTTTIIQPMDQGTISAFKARYLKTTFTQTIEAIDSGADLSCEIFGSSTTFFL